MYRLRFVVFFGLVIFWALGSVDAYAQKVHPRNQEMIKRGLLPPSILQYFPDVPKISAHEAMALYMEGKAVFIAIGTGTPRIMDGWLLIDYMGFDPRRLAFYGIPVKDKFIIPY